MLSNFLVKIFFVKNISAKITIFAEILNIEAKELMERFNP